MATPNIEPALLKHQQKQKWKFRHTQESIPMDRSNN